MVKIITTDVLIVGSGGAGFLAAHEAARTGVDVMIIDKGLIGKSGCTVGAQNIAAVTSGNVEDDSTEMHYQDTICAGKMINNPKLVRVLVEEAENCIKEMEQMGIIFERAINGKYILLPMNGHSRSRSLYLADITGKVMLDMMRGEAQRLGIKMLSDVMVISLLCNEGKVAGIVGLDFANDQFIQVIARAVIVTTGGIGQLYPVTTNCDQATGDGMALALKAGCMLIDLEQYQFYPAVVVEPQAMKGYGLGMLQFGKLYNNKGERFMKKYAPDTMENSTRDLLSFGIYSEIRAGNCSKNNAVYLDVSEVEPDILEAYDAEVRLFTNIGIDLKKQRVEISPGAHYFMGGIKINENCETQVRGLFAAGEVTGGIHGANRLGNNSLLDCVVFGKRAGRAAGLYAMAKRDHPPVYTENSEEVNRVQRLLDKGRQKYKPSDIKQSLQIIMWEHVGIIRNTKGLEDALEQIELLTKKLHEQTGFTSNRIKYNRQLEDYLETENMLLLAKAMVKSAITRKESRGAHYIEDYPATDDAKWLVNTEVCLRNNELVVSLSPVSNGQI